MNKNKFSFFTVKENPTTKDKIFMVALFGLLFLSILIYKITATETVPLLLLACLTALLCGACYKQLQEPMTRRKARATMVIGFMCLGITVVILYLLTKPLFIH